MSEPSILELEDFALELARTSGAIAHAHFRRSFTIENKGGSAFDPVTSADRAIERVLRDAHRRAFSRSRNRGRGGGRSSRAIRIHVVHRSDRRYACVHDGITAVGHARRVDAHDTPLFGLLSQPVLEEVFFGAPSGSWLIKPDRRDRLKTRRCEALASAALASTHPDMFTGAGCRGVSHARRKVPAASLRRRLLQLRNACGRVRGSRRRGATETIRHRAADSRARRCGRRRDRLVWQTAAKRGQRRCSSDA